MPDQKKMIEDYLDELSLSAEGWRVVDPAYGDVKDNVYLQKNAPRAADALTARLYLPRTDLEVLPPDKSKKESSRVSAKTYDQITPPHRPKPKLHQLTHDSPKQPQTLH